MGKCFLGRKWPLEEIGSKAEWSHHRSGLIIHPLNKLAGLATLRLQTTHNATSS